MIDSMDKRVWVMHMRRLRFEAELLQEVGQGFIAIGWKQIDLRHLKTRDEIADALKKLEALKERAIIQYSSQLHRFGYMMQKGELVVLPISGSQKIKIGRVADNQLCRDESFDEEYVHQRKVEWLKEVNRTDYSQQARNSIGSFSTISLGSPTVLAETVALLEGQNIQKDEYEEEAAEEDPLANLEELLSEKLDEHIALIIDDNTGHKYTSIVASVLRAMGYVTEVAPPGPDGKRDIMAYPDELQLKDPMIRVEVKSSKNPVRVEDVRALKGALKGSERGLFVARAGYTKDARDFARDIPDMTLMDGEEVIGLLLKYYDKLDADTQALIPLKQVWIPRV